MVSRRRRAMPSISPGHCAERGRAERAAREEMGSKHGCRRELRWELLLRLHQKRLAAQRSSTDT